MLINSDDIKKAKEHLEVMQAFIDGKEIEYKKKFAYDFGQCTTPTWDFDNYAYRIKPSEPEYIYPIYKRLKTTPETVVKFTSLDEGIYVSTYKNSIYKPGNIANNMAPHTDSSWEDAPRRIIDIVRDSNGKIVDLVDRPSKPENANTEELFEVIYYCEIMKEFEFVKQLYKNEDLENKEHLQKTGRSFIFDKDTKQIIRVVNA